ncbi:DUF6049 family protein [Curtobacterium sp. MCJR17_043]|uniref:DUF6049 family protein n=1 Tax=Curtobacterium sp. MCJR17_043 TaxID=2175660 RepID=UPI0024E00B3C|nr:DUF6049 family protein [Curtobacterium sp. MCJR17_043]WIB36081.1 DUF6049 family protein [Curtobacterium sp. MCJR17_043]
MQILRTVLAAAASALVATGLVIAPAAMDVADAATTTKPADPSAAQSGTTSVALTPSGRGVLELGDDLSLSLTVTNDTDAALPAGERRPRHHPTRGRDPGHPDRLVGRHHA